MRWITSLIQPWKSKTWCLNHRLTKPNSQTDKPKSHPILLDHPMSTQRATDNSDQAQLVPPGGPITYRKKVAKAHKTALHTTFTSIKMEFKKKSTHVHICLIITDYPGYMSLTRKTRATTHPLPRDQRTPQKNRFQDSRHPSQTDMCPGDAPLTQRTKLRCPVRGASTSKNNTNPNGRLCRLG